MSIIEPHADNLTPIHYYRQILDNSIDIIYLIEVTPEGRFIHLHINDAFAKSVALPKEAIVGRFVDELEDKGFRETLSQKYTSCINAGEKTEFIGNYNLPIGQKIYHSTLAPIRNENGRIHRIVGIARDITERKRDEERLRHSEEAFRTLAEHYPDIIVRYDRSCQRTYVNPTYVRMSGLSADSLIGKTPEYYSHLIAPKYFMSELSKVIKSESPSELEVAVFRENGEMGWYIASLVPEFDHQEVVGVLCVARDITHAKEYETMLQKSSQMEKILSRIAANLPGFIYTLRRSPDGNACFPYASSGIITLFGLYPKDLSTDMSVIYSLIHPEDLPSIQEAITISASELSPCHIIFRTHISGREERWIEARATPKAETQSDGILWHGVMLDITERKQMEAKLNAHTLQE